MRALQSLNRVVISLVCATHLGLARLASAEEINPKGWPIPDISSARFYKHKMVDAISEIPGAETRLGTYKSKGGTYFNTLEIMIDGKWKLYGFYVDTDGKPPMEYTLIDGDGDGKFERKNIEGGGTETPSWLLAQR